MKNYYDILQIPVFSSVARVKKAYRRLARIVHPDLNPACKDARERFIEINEAHQVLAHPRRKTIYDRQLKAGFAKEIESLSCDRTATSSLDGLSELMYTIGVFIGCQILLAKNTVGLVLKIFFRVLGFFLKWSCSALRKRGRDVVEEYEECSVFDGDAEAGTEVSLRLFQRPVRVRIPAGTKDGAVLEFRHPVDRRRMARVKVRRIPQPRPILLLKVSLTDQLLGRKIAFDCQGMRYQLDLGGWDCSTHRVSFGTFDVELLLDDEEAIRRAMDESSRTTLNNCRYYREALR